MREKKANLFVIGASKCGTTFMHDLLDQHPAIYMSTIKEPRFFQRDDFAENFDWYQSLYGNSYSQDYLGEASPSYSETIAFPEIPRRIYEYNTGAKLIYIVRSPMKRLESVWIQAQSSGHWVETKDYGIKMPMNYRDAVFEYPPFLDATRYWTHIQNYLKHFDDSSLKVIFFEDLIRNPVVVMRDVFDFLSIDNSLDLTLDDARTNSHTEKKMYNPWPSRMAKLVPDFAKKLCPRVLREGVSSALGVLPVSKLIEPKLCTDDKFRIRQELTHEVKSLYRFMGVQEDRWGFFDEVV